MADINSNKNAIIIQPITLQIRAPFQFLTNQRAIKHTHYSESRDREILILTLTRADVGFELSLIPQSEQIC